MTRYYLIILAISILASCSTPVEEGIPEDLGAKRTLLTDKKKELKALKDNIAELELMIQKQSGIIPEDSYPLVSLDTISKTTFKKYLTLPASVATDDLVTISSELGGRILSLRIKEGQYIKKGSLIASLDNENIRYQKAELETRLQLATTIFEKRKNLWDQKIGSELQYLEAENNKEAVEKTLSTLNYQMSKFNVYAPISGVVDMKLAKQGEVVGPGQPIATMMNTASIKIQVDVPENYLQSVKKGDKVEVNFPALNEQRNARIDLIGSRINPDNRSFKIEMTMRNKGGILKPNLLAEVRILEKEEKDVVVIPVNMIQEEVGGKTYVYTFSSVDGKNIAIKNYLQTGQSYENAMVIEKGLKAGDIIITSGAQDLRNQQSVRLK